MLGAPVVQNLMGRQDPTLPLVPHLVHQWPDRESFQAFMEQAQPDIGPVMEAGGVTSQPSVTFWRALDTRDAVGWASLSSRPDP